MVGQVEVAGIILPFAGNDQDRFITLVFAKVFTPVVIIQAKDVAVEPNLTTSEGRTTLLFQGYFMDIILSQNISHGLTSFDGNLAEVLFKHQLVQTGFWFQGHADHFGLGIRIYGEIIYFRSGSAHSNVVFLVSGNAVHGETLDIIRTSLTIAVNRVINGSFIVLLEDVEMQDVFTDEHFVHNFHNLIASIFEENNDIVDVGTIAHEFIFP